MVQKDIKIKIRTKQILELKITVNKKKNFNVILSVISILISILELIKHKKEFVGSKIGHLILSSQKRKKKKSRKE